MENVNLPVGQNTTAAAVQSYTTIHHKHYSLIASGQDWKMASKNLAPEAQYPGLTGTPGAGSSTPPTIES